MKHITMAALIDGVNGDLNWRKGNWQGYQNNNMVAVIDLGKIQSVQSITLNCLQDINAWIVYPKQINFYTSTNGKTFFKAGEITNQLNETDTQSAIKNFTINMASAKIKFIKIEATQYGALPSWHLGAGGQSHIFVDEIEIR
jgi:hypothetical protein